MADRIVILEPHRRRFPGRVDTLEAFLAAAPEVFREQRRTRIFRGPGGIFLKLYTFPGIEGIATPFGRSTAEREFENLCAFRGAGVDVPSPIGYAVRKRAGFVVAAAIAEEVIEGAEDLRQWAERNGAMPGGGGRERARVLDALGASLARLHIAGIVHGGSGAHFRNILLRREEGEVRLFFTDMPGARFARGRALERGRARDLGRLLVNADRYLGEQARQRLFEAYHATARTPIERRLGLELAAEDARRRFANETWIASLAYGVRRRVRRLLGITSEVRSAHAHGS